MTVPPGRPRGGGRQRKRRGGVPDAAAACGSAAREPPEGPSRGPETHAGRCIAERWVGRWMGWIRGDDARYRCNRLGCEMGDCNFLHFVDNQIPENKLFMSLLQTMEGTRNLERFVFTIKSHIPFKRDAIHAHQHKS